VDVNLLDVQMRC